MMKLETMQAVVATVNEQWESDLADQIMQAWAHDAERAKYWRASANFVFFSQAAGQRRILRFNHASERTATAMQAETNYVRQLAAQGIRVAKPIASLAGNDVESINTPKGLFHAVTFEAMPGTHWQADELTATHFVHWGKALGQLHNASMRCTNPGRPTWRDHLAFVDETLPTQETAARHALQQITQQLAHLPRTAQNFGLIHYDFELDNILWDGENAGIIDFDDSAAYWYVADIAYALRDLFEDDANNVDLHNDSFQHFIEGYRSVRAISPEELQQIPLFLHMHHLVSFARLYRAVPATALVDEFAWMTTLRQKLAATMQRYRKGFSNHTSPTH